MRARRVEGQPQRTARDHGDRGWLYGHIHHGRVGVAAVVRRLGRERIGPDVVEGRRVSRQPAREGHRPVTRRRHQAEGSAVLKGEIVNGRCVEGRRDSAARYDRIDWRLGDDRHVDAPVPDLVICLQAPVEVLMQRIQNRGIPAEMLIEEQYLANLISAYTDFFHYYNKSTLLLVNCADMDFVNNDEDYQLLLNHISTMRKGTRNYFNPRPALL